VLMLQEASPNIPTSSPSRDQSFTLKSMHPVTTINP